MSVNVMVRCVEINDHLSWKTLWDGYNEFYGRVGDNKLSDEITKKMSQPRQRWIATITKQTKITGTKGEAPTTARLSIEPSNTKIMLSSGVRIPKDRRPEIRMSKSAIRNMAKPRAHICHELIALSSPKICINVSIRD